MDRNTALKAGKVETQSRRNQRPFVPYLSLLFLCYRRYTESAQTTSLIIIFLPF